jgi:hypothetical protein
MGRPPLLLHAIPVIINGQVRLRIYRGRNLEIEMPLRQRQALVLAAQILNLALMAERDAAADVRVLEAPDQEHIAGIDAHARNITAPWLDHTDPAEQMLELHTRLLDATDQFVASELEVRAAVRARNRALDAMRDIRFHIQQLDARHGLEPPPTRFGRLLDGLNDGSVREGPPTA